MDQITPDLHSAFLNPPKQYGEVAFYWWIGEKLTKERLKWHLSMLKGHHMSGLQVNYCHSDKGGAIYGLPYKSDPPLFSDAWWELFRWFLKEAKKEDIAVALSDYTLGTAGQGYFMDEILQKNPDICGAALEYNCTEIQEQQSVAVPEYGSCERLLGIYAYLKNGERVLLDSADGMVDVPAGCRQISFVSCRKKPNSLDPMHPDSGRSVVETFFQPFENHNPGEGGTGLNFFFSDELNFNISGKLWDDRFAEEFIRRKGYDILPYLDAIFTDIGDITQKIRLDYYELIVQLEEENYFGPVYNWHQERHMTYGCDHGGRGRDVVEFGDYFRTQKYNQGPGNDQPRLGSDIIKNKVSSSISHLYRRPRTWLEGFYGSGWNTSSSDVADAVFRNFAMGHNLLTLHGLYYTTMGGFWEWAPPCNHFRMPYWKNMDHFLGCSERLSYLLSRGHHVCDVAILYPVADVEGGLNGDTGVKTAFEAGELLYSHGIDFDFIDFQSIINGTISDRRLCAADARYQIMILPSVKTIRHGAMEKIAAFAAAGGIVINLGDLPVASEYSGRNSKALEALNQILKDNSAIFLDNCSSLLETIRNSINTDIGFETPVESPYVLHRRTAEQDIYFLYNIPRNSLCRFRAIGTPTIYNPWDGSVLCLKAESQTETDTLIRMPLDIHEAQVIVFEKNRPDVPFYKTCVPFRSEPIEGLWEFDLEPTLDNRFGDFRMPAGCPPVIGAEVRRLQYTTSLGQDIVTIGYGPKFRKYGPLPEDPELEQKLITQRFPKDIPSAEYAFSWRYGFEGDPGHQGYHGLKGQVTDDFLTFGKPEIRRRSIQYHPEEAGPNYYFKTSVTAEETATAYIHTGEVVPAAIWCNGEPVTGCAVTLKKGRNDFLLKFSTAGRSHFILSRVPQSDFVQTYPLSMRWFRNPDVIPFDLYAGMDMHTSFRFTTPPGMETMTIRSRYPLTLKIDDQVPALDICKDGDITVYRYAASAARQLPCAVTLTCDAPEQEYAGCILEDYISFTCGTGLMPQGAWENYDGLRSYSGGAVYRKEVQIPSIPPEIRVLLDLGSVCSSCELAVNGRKVGVRTAPEWKFDITDYLTEGKNTLAVTVYNTLSNHYSTIPSKYNQPVESGLLGPVKIVYARTE